MRAWVECVRATINHWAGWPGLLFGAVSIFTGWWQSMTPLIFCALAALMFLLRAVLLQKELLEIRSAKANPDISLLDVVERAIGFEDIFNEQRNPAAWQEVEKTLEQIIEAAAGERITLFGIADWRNARPRAVTYQARVPIPAEHWRDHYIDWGDFHTDSACASRRRGGPPNDPSGYANIYACARQVQTIWPSKRWILEAIRLRVAVRNNAH
jgi:hypothetical protein